MTNVQRAKEIADKAVSFDGEQQYQQAIAHYADAILLMQESLSECDERQTTITSMFSNIYRDRLEALIDVVVQEGSYLNVPALSKLLSSSLLTMIEKNCSKKPGEKQDTSKAGGSTQFGKKLDRANVPSYDPASFGIDKDVSKIRFIDQPFPADEPSIPPKDHTLKLFWFARNIKKSISDGAWISPRVYLTPSFWNSKDCKVPQMSDKDAFIREALSLFDLLYGIDFTTQFPSSRSVLIIILDGLERGASAISKHVSVIVNPNWATKKTERTVKGNLADIAKKMQNLSAQASNSFEYHMHLRALLEKISFFLEWYTYFTTLMDPGKPFIDLINKIMSIIEATLFEYLVRDIGTLVDFYSTNFRESFFKLYKKH
ncbi:hypothetical protein BLNAU_19575 [Blattamonas nauphoetae]|uniref:MIT domain-containing protein n=1 Tax=Blattamonas nauphoetae TaxID=2049346 RepID=A0ABQ9X1D5_9EUKA|nr:hypothetical protein BLNAU_19575 [Blattamonas nauphoetae]